jgi:LysM repeat protein
VRQRSPGERRPGPVLTWAAGLAAAVGLAIPLGAAERSPAGSAWCHEVRRGDSLAAVARRTGTSVERLRHLNAMRGHEVLPAGQIIALPALARLRSGNLPLAGDPMPARPGQVARENAAADRQRLSRMHTRAQLDRFVRVGLLVPVAPSAPGVRVVGVPRWRRVARPWTRQFVHQLGAALHQLFGSHLRVTDLTRTEAVQTALLATNLNAAPARGPHRSSHLTGASVDLSKTGHSEAELSWLRLVLRRLAGRGVLSAIEEFVQPHFHVMVFRGYTGYARRLRHPVLIGGC